jgi:type IV secretory pathway ATPase VirB11/archaellum biosynthesis ATPase
MRPLKNLDTLKGGSLLKKLKSLRGALYRKLIKKKEKPLNEVLKYKTRAAQLIAMKKGKLRKLPKEKLIEEMHTTFRILPINRLPEIIPRGKKTRVIYTLIRPFAYADIRWSADEETLMYNVMEPKLNEKERKILEKIKEGLVQVIDVGLDALKKHEKMLGFLEKNVKMLINEYGFELSRESYMKIMYYVYRDFLGLNEIEPLLNDPFIEDIGCDGVGIPIYVIHKILGSLKTNIVYNDLKDLREFVIKLAERCDRYISYAEPLLDGSLPDGTRVQASLAGDVTTRGPTFSIRKFPEKPFTPIDIIKFNTASSEIMAYLWFSVEHGANVLIAGGVATGKTSFLNAISLFIRPEAKIVSIEDSITGDCEIIVRKNGKILKEKIGDFIDQLIKEFGAVNSYGAEKVKSSKDIEILTVDENYKVKFVRPSSLIRHKVEKDIYEVKTASGRKIKVTQDHSLFTFSENDLKQVKPQDLENGGYIATPRRMPEGPGLHQINLLENLGYFNGCFLEGEPVERILKETEPSEFSGFVSISGYKYWKKNNIIKVEAVQRLIDNGFRFSERELKDIKIRTRNKNQGLPVLFPITDDFLVLLGLWIGDGSYDGYNKNRVIITNSDTECQRVVERFAKKNNINVSIMADKISLSLNSTLLYKLMLSLGFKGKASTKRIPDLVFNLSNQQLSKFLSGYFSADGGLKKYEVTCSSQSIGLLRDIQNLLLRFEILSRIFDYDRKDKCIELSISSYPNTIKFKEAIGFLQERKNNKLQIICGKTAHHTKTDIIPTDENLIERVDKVHKLSWPYHQGMQNIGRPYLQSLMGAEIFDEDEDFSDLKTISDSDIFWDRIKEVKKLDRKIRYVYDISVPCTEKFICNDIILHNTRELNLPHENWIPGVSRIGFTGTRTGEVNMFDLLKESFRQNPDYLIVGETRGEEAAIMFQGMASGHPTMSTIHGGSLDDIIRRLETRPINLSPGLLETLDIVIVMVHAREKGKSARRVKEIMELERVDPESGRAQTNKAFSWLPHTDTFEYRGRSWFLEKVSKEKGIPMSNIIKEIAQRKKYLNWILKKNITDWKETARLITLYYKNKEKAIKLMGEAV